MLVLTRKEGETILLGSEIKVTVLEVKDGQVRLGIEAPREVTIYRQELYEAISEENKQAVVNKPVDLLADALLLAKKYTEPKREEKNKKNEQREEK